MSLATQSESRVSFIVFQELLLHSNAQLYKDLMAGKARYTHAGVVAVMELWKELLDKGYFAPMDATYTEDIPAMLAEGSLTLAPFRRLVWSEPEKSGFDFRQRLWGL